MIISASRRTDLPGLYAPWLRAVFAKGRCTVRNPFNAKQVQEISLHDDDVDAVVFWTRHARPVLDWVPVLLRRGYRFYFQYTITGYPRALEARTPPVDVAIRTCRELAARLPAGAVVWRYDPLLVGDALPAAYHAERFARIASGLEGAVRRVVVSTVEPYRKTVRRVGARLEWGKDLYQDGALNPAVGELLLRLVTIARAHGIDLEACAPATELTALRIRKTKCIDDALLAALFGGAWPHTKDRGQRAACACIPSKDIGAVDTCTFGCAYCYATRSDPLAHARRRTHDPNSDRLIP
ncbi:MAG: DUF1848 domain-containing protein [Deltaproteobacteria bacterium]|nr:DUF1848 domain-containing protein [Deltaproteobacteria bacterium]